MKNNIVFGIIILTIIVFFNYSIGFAADGLYRLMHNDHDALVLGKVIEVSEDKITIDVKKQIISLKDLNVSSPKKQIPLKGNVTIKGIEKYFFFNEADSVESSPQIDDYVLASIVKKGLGFTNAWGIFKVDSTDYKTLNILYPKEASKYERMDAFAIKTFVNSDGRKIDFSFDGSEGKVYLNGKVIYEAGIVDDEKIINKDTIAPSFSNTNKKEVKKNIVSNYSNNRIIFLIMMIISALVVIWIYILKEKKKRS